MIRAILTSVLVCVAVSSATGGVMSDGPPVMPWPEIAVSASPVVQPTSVQKVLTFLAVANDCDCDGFVDDGPGREANPCGYVVLNPFSWTLNVRVTLGQSQADWQEQPLPDTHSGGSWAAGDDVRPMATVPEPMTVMLLAGGFVAVAWRRRKAAL